MDTLLICSYFQLICSCNIYVLNLLSDEKKVYDVNDYENQLYKVEYVNDYILLENSIYASSGNCIYKINITSGEILRYDNRTQRTKTYDLLFSDEKKIYALTNINSNSFRLEELVFGNETDASILSTKELK